MLRQRGSKKGFNKVAELDAFPKVPETYVEPTPEGGSLSVLTFFFIIWLIYSEVSYYLDSSLVFRFVPDTDMDTKLKINMDLTIAMPCSSLGADILDSTSQSVFGFGELQEEDTWFDLEPHQREYFDSMQYLNSYLREEYHNVYHLLWNSGHDPVFHLPQRKEKPKGKFDACRFHGSLILNKVSGNFHITAGKSLHLPQGHIHLSMLFDDTPQNFSHRINRLSFGDSTSGIVHPLEGDEQITDEEQMMYQYFIEVVPTDVETTLSRLQTFQYSVKEYSRPVSHNKGSHGIPGIFVKYDVAALKVIISKQRENIVQFTLRLFSVVGGIYIIVGCLNNLLHLAKEAIIGTNTPNVLAGKETVTKSNNSLLMQPNLTVPMNIVRQ